LAGITLGTSWSVAVAFDLSLAAFSACFASATLAWSLPIGTTFLNFQAQHLDSSPIKAINSETMRANMRMSGSESALHG
jgi:hypothetical protein